jgi:hypothetical protein
VGNFCRQYDFTHDPCLVPVSNAQYPQ